MLVFFAFISNNIRNLHCGLFIRISFGNTYGDMEDDETRLTEM